ncbi:MAG: pyridoxamine 5'-phosphate oxidase family protein [Myxococcales bacterium]|nr:pyridoxamine 5'-phosphate oxidase family protein [Myxococcales bacterium]
MSRGAPACITTTLVDGLVFGRSAFRHSMNCRSVVLYGHGQEVEVQEDDP